VREARNSNSAVATEQNNEKEKWQKQIGSLDIADLTRRPHEKFE